MGKATTVRFSDEIYARLDQASSRTGMPVNSIVVAACLEWVDRHTPSTNVPRTVALSPLAPAPRWSTIRRAVELAVAKRPSPGMYPFESFSQSARKLLIRAQEEAQKAGLSYIGTEHLLLASFADQTSHAAIVLTALDVREPEVRAALDEILSGKKTAPRSHVVPTSRVKRVIEIAFKLCGAAGDPRVSTAHILLALATEGQGIAAHVLKDAGVTGGRLETAIGELREPEA